ncbi:MAG: hypothetical protein IJ213_02685 [Bacteroidales bacterium]|nr:hypothetical protein [Bacteroidales bacterium]MBQ9311932.1 hypothetical protein [Bacteroidales bacterium]
MAFELNTILFSLILVISLIAIVYFVGKGKLFNKKRKDKDFVYLSKTGSIIFYVFMLLLLLFFVIMYIKWRAYLNA